MRLGVGRQRLQRLFRLFVAIFALALGYVLLDFAIDLRPSTVQDSYRFELPALDFDTPKILRRDNLAILVIRRSAQTLESLAEASDGLQDAVSARSRQPAYARNPLRSRDPEYFVAYALGTDFGCPLVAEANRLRESCGSAAYDYAGRALTAEQRFLNLPIPDYTFDPDFTRLTVRP